MQTSGSRTVQWRKTGEIEIANIGTPRQLYRSISAMPEYSSKSFEELRWEDFQVSFVFHVWLVSCGSSLANCVTAAAYGHMYHTECVVNFAA